PCSASTIARYQKRISGLLLDRTDIHVEVPQMEYEKLTDRREGARSETLRDAPRRSEAVRTRIQAEGCTQCAVEAAARPLLRASCIPDRPQRELRELTRYRTRLIEERAAEVNRVQQTLEGATSKSASVASDLQGKSAQAILRALVTGTDDAPP